jgi:hypothetical protein
MKGRIATGLVVATISGAWCVSAGQAQEASTDFQQLQQELATLRARVIELEKAQAAAKPATQPAPNDAERTASAVEEDAAHRSKMMDPGVMTGGHAEGKFFLKSEDGAFLLVPSVQIQARFTANYAEDRPDGGESLDDGFEVRRAKFALEGNAFNPDLTYRFQIAANRSGGNTVLEDAWARYKYDGNWSVKGGQFIEPVFHEQLVSSKRQLAADRTLLAEYLTGGESFSQGVSVAYATGKLRTELMLNDGIKAVNTDFTDDQGGILGITPDMGVAARIEYQASGTAKQYDDFTARGNTTDLLVFGAGAEYSAEGDESGLWHTVDAQWEPQAVKGLSVYGAYVGLLRELSDGSGSTDSTYDYGALVQGGYMLGERWEAFGRYDVMILDDTASTFSYSADTFSEITGGVNYYCYGHAAKFTIDLTFLPDGAPTDATGLGILAGSDEPQTVLRAQFQLLL